MSKMYQWKKCPICNSREIIYAFKIETYRFVRCASCQFIGINPQPSDEELLKIYKENYAKKYNNEAIRKISKPLSMASAKETLDLVERYFLGIGLNLKAGKVLEISPKNDDFLKYAKNFGYRVLGVGIPEGGNLNFEKNINYFVGSLSELINDYSYREYFDLIIFKDTLEYVRSPDKFLEKVNILLSKKGVILCTTPSLDSMSAKLQKSDWIEFKPEHLHYFNEKNIRKLFCNANFTNIRIMPEKKWLTTSYICQHFDVYKKKFWTKIFKAANKILPQVILHKKFKLGSGGMLLMASKMVSPRRDLVTVIMPVYNEINTIKDVIDGVMNLKRNDCDFEIVIVESNSNDGTKGVVSSYEGRERIKVIYESSPSGKGLAVRKGLEASQGSIVIIQDADSEYDFLDYDALLDKIIYDGYPFVLGSRHGGAKWKVRHLHGEPILTFVANTMHWFITYLINFLYSVKLTDPFTMFKVFRKDIIRGLSFETKRFDFDYELLLKLIRQGYIPIEIPVNYTARSFANGKKVRFFRDPITWFRAIFKYRKKY